MKIGKLNTYSGYLFCQIRYLLSQLLYEKNCHCDGLLSFLQVLLCLKRMRLHLQYGTNDEASRCLQIGNFPKLLYLTRQPRNINPSNPNSKSNDRALKTPEPFSQRQPTSASVPRLPLLGFAKPLRAARSGQESSTVLQIS